MQAIFLSHGPFAASAVEAKHVVGLPAPCRIGRDLWLRYTRQSDAPNRHLPDDFHNLEVYNLLTKILAIDRHAASNNGTKGFWDSFS